MDRINDTARGLHQDWQGRAPYRSLARDMGLTTTDQAYQAQEAVQALHVPTRGRIVGRKIALASAAMQQMVGMDQPVSGAIFANDIKQSPAQVRLSDFVHLGVEFELAIVLGADVAPSDGPFSAASVAGLVAAVHPAFELIEDRAADYGDLDPLTLIADNAWCGGVVLGPAIENGPALDLSAQTGVVQQTGQAEERASTGAADPLGSLAWVLTHFAARGQALARGEVIITGSAVRTRFPGPGDVLRYEVAGAAVEIDVTG